jgi:uncharacterized membrane protein
MTFNAPATVFLVLLKGAVSGLLGGVVYSLLENKNRSLAIILAAIVTPLVNTLIFFVGCFVFFFGLISEWAGDGNIVLFVITGMIGVNFLVELGINVIFVPTVERLINIKKYA